MIYNLGTTVPLTWTNPDIGVATLAVTNPNGQVTTVSNIANAGGVYSGTYNPSVAGLHQVLWTATAQSTKGSYEDVFEVRQSAPTALISAQDAREWLRLRSTDTVDNTKIQVLIESASSVILDITGPMGVGSYIEFFDGGIDTVMPSKGYTLISVTAAYEYYGLSKFVLTEQPLGTQTNAFAFTVDYITGQITRRTYGGAPAQFAIGSKNVEIHYTAGRTTVPENVQMAAKELVRHLYQSTQTPGRAKMGGPANDGFGEVNIGYAIPNFVVELLQPHRRAPGIA